MLLICFDMPATLDFPNNIGTNQNQLRKCISEHISKADSKQNAIGCQ